VLGEYPQSSAAGALLVQAATARTGATAGLSAYEHWLGTRKIDDAYLLRQVALAYVREVARDARALAEARQHALRALSEDRDITTLMAIGRAADAGGLVELQILAGLGSPTAVERLVTDMQQVPGNKGRFLTALGDARAVAAIPAIEALLTDPLPENRASAAEVLAKLAARDSVLKIRPLLTDMRPFVRFSAAAALYKLGDTSGLSYLRELESSEHSLIRAQALEVTSTNPDASWQAAVRRLVADPDPGVRLLAARLIAPHDIETASMTLEGLLADGNLAIRESAGATFVEAVASDFGVLRRFLRSGDPITRVKAAGRILALTR
jgi:hypothetical protein